MGRHDVLDQSFPSTNAFYYTKRTSVPLLAMSHDHHLRGEKVLRNRKQQTLVYKIIVNYVKCGAFQFQIGHQLRFKKNTSRTMLPGHGSMPLRLNLDQIILSAQAV